MDVSKNGATNRAERDERGNRHRDPRAPPRYPARAAIPTPWPARRANPSRGVSTRSTGAVTARSARALCAPGQIARGCELADLREHVRPAAGRRARVRPAHEVRVLSARLIPARNGWLPALQAARRAQDQQQAIAFLRACLDLGSPPLAEGSEPHASFRERHAEGPTAQRGAAASAASGQPRDRSDLRSTVARATHARAGWRHCA